MRTNWIYIENLLELLEIVGRINLLENGDPDLELVQFRFINQTCQRSTKTHYRNAPTVKTCRKIMSRKGSNL